MISVVTAERKNKEIFPVDVYDGSRAWGLYASVDIHNCEPEFIRNKEILRQYVLQLSEILSMKCCGSTQISDLSNLTDSGCSMTQFIESSILTGHFEYKSNTAFIDMFSSKLYDPEVFSHFSLSYFKGSTYKLNVTVRK
jgi:hypothetical protein